jgi:hypothetical protein
MREHGQRAVGQSIARLGLDRAFGFKPGTRFERGLALVPGKNYGLSGITASRG